MFYWGWRDETYFDALDTTGLVVFSASDLGDFEESDFTIFDVSGLVALGDRRFAFFSGVFVLV